MNNNESVLDMLAPAELAGAGESGDRLPVESAPRAVPDAEEANRQRFLAGPILPALLSMALPILIVLAVQTFVSVAETYFVGRLGTDALAGMTLVFPMIMLMTMVSNGGIGGGVSAAIAQAVGAQRTQDANALVLHTLVLGLVFGLLFTVGVWVGGPALYHSLGGNGASLHNALAYSNLAFGAAIPIWTLNLLSAALRGAGDVKTPAILIVAGALITLVLSPLLIFGWGPVPSFGVAGAGMAMIIYYVGATLVLMAFMRSQRSAVRLVKAPLEWRLFKSILGVGLMAAIGALQSSLLVVLLTGLVGHFGAQALAGYGAGSRLDDVIMPLLFALGTASVTIVGTNVGAGQAQRARQVTSTVAWLSGLVVACIGITAALFPHTWAHLFSDRVEVTDVSVHYLTRVAPFYVFAGFGMAVLFASQGAQRIIGTSIAATISIAITAFACWYCVSVYHGSIEQLFWVVGLSRLLFGVLLTGVFFKDPEWGESPAQPAVGS